jgi:predicted O-methyltransferase YrrM
MRKSQAEFERFRRQPRNDMWEYMEFLRDLASQSQAILEIGVRGGVSTACFLSGLEANGGHLWSIDRDASCVDLYPQNPNWTFIHADSRELRDVNEWLPRYALDVLFIDGGHDFKTVWADLENYAPRVKADGWILMHDAYPIAHQRWQHGVPEAYQNYLRLTGFPGEILPGRFGLAAIRKVVSVHA